jgi:hypothetical protein
MHYLALRNALSHCIPHTPNDLIFLTAIPMILNFSTGKIISHASMHNAIIIIVH